MSLDAELAKLNEVVGGVSIPFDLDSKSLKEESNGTLILRGILATCGLDRHGEEFDETSLRREFEKYFARHPVVVDEHRLSKVLGRLTSYKFTKHGDIYVEAEVPKPPEGDAGLMATYQRIKAGVLSAFSIGGRWKRLPTGSGVEKLFPQEILEASIAGIGVNKDALFEVVGVKALGGDLDAELARLSDLTAASSPLDEALERLP